MLPDVSPARMVTDSAESEYIELLIVVLGSTAKFTVTSSERGAPSKTTSILSSISTKSPDGATPVFKDLDALAN